LDEDQPAGLAKRASPGQQLLSGCITAAGDCSAGFRDHLGTGQEGSTQRQLLLPIAIGQESEVADVNKAGGQYMKEKATDELNGIQGHRFGLTTSGIVLPFKGDSPRGTPKTGQ
jgi:hypothetical protein